MTRKAYKEQRKAELLYHLSTLREWLIGETPVIDWDIFPVNILSEEIERQVNDILNDRQIRIWHRLYWRYRFHHDLSEYAESWRNVRDVEDRASNGSYKPLPVRHAVAFSLALLLSIRRLFNDHKKDDNEIRDL